MVTKLISIKISDLTFHRAGSDFLRKAWSAHVSGFAFVRGETYRIVRDDRSTFKVVAGPTSRGQTIIIDAEDYSFTRYARWARR